MIDLSICTEAHLCHNRETCEHARLHKHMQSCGGRGCVTAPGTKPKYLMCIRYKDRKFRVGDRVVFYENKHNYSIGESNPVYGSKHFCAGTITSTGGGISVSWDNGAGNGYEIDDLVHEHVLPEILKGKKVDPNLSFKFRRKRI